jgi:hypothetical protein
MTPRKIAILFHERQRGFKREYMIHHFALIWEADGHHVFPLFGTREFVPADVLIVHADVSVVPDEYLEFARRYPVALNGEVKDIRKTAYSRLRLQRADDYAGKVIVKSNLNYAGQPERVLGLAAPRTAASNPHFASPLQYRVYDRLSAVPAWIFDDPELLVEKFLPEFEDGYYYMRAMTFLGERTSCTRMRSAQPIVNGSSIDLVEDVEPHPDILAIRRATKFDYGKFDYVIHQGKALLLDMNKTVGAPPPSEDPKILAGRRSRAEGLYAFFAPASTRVD